MGSPPTRTFNKLIRLVAVNIGLLLLLLVLAEGLSSCLLLGHDLLTTRALAERRHTQYDPELGWVGLPDLHLPDMYGPGIDLTTNSQGFRAERDVPVRVPAGKVRVICSGDSFTLGYGVSNDQTWCRQLAALDPSLETVNMGQGGYCIGQAFLWYRRDGARLDHDLQILAFITDDFQRMRSEAFIGYGKPRITTDGNHLVVENVPVPRRGYTFSWLVKNRHNFKRLRMAELLIAALGRDRGSGGVGRVTPAEKRETRAVFSGILGELKLMNREKSSRLVLVYFPVLDELLGEPPQEWIDLVREEAERHDVLFIDLVTEFRLHPLERMTDLFIAEGELDYPAAAGHFNESGNRFVAELIYERLAGHQVIAAIPLDGMDGDEG